MELTKRERELLSFVVSDLLTGNHLLGRKRTEEQRNMMREFCEAAKAVDEEQMLTERHATLIKAMGEQFYGGIEDMAEQLTIDKNKLKQAGIW